MGCRAVGSEEPELDATLVVAAIAGLMLQQLASDLPDFEGRVLRPALERLFAPHRQRGDPVLACRFARVEEHDGIAYREAGPADGPVALFAARLPGPPRSCGATRWRRWPRPAGAAWPRTCPGYGDSSPTCPARGSASGGAGAVPLGPGPGGRAAGGPRLGRADRPALGLRPPRARRRAGGHLRHRLLPRRQVARHGRGHAHAGRGRGSSWTTPPAELLARCSGQLCPGIDRGRPRRVLQGLSTPERRHGDAGHVPLGRLREARALRGQAGRAGRAHPDHLGRGGRRSPRSPARTACASRDPGVRAGGARGHRATSCGGPGAGALLPRSSRRFLRRAR